MIANVKAVFGAACEALAAAAVYALVAGGICAAVFLVAAIRSHSVSCIAGQVVWLGRMAFSERIQEERRNLEFPSGTFSPDLACSSTSSGLQLSMRVASVTSATVVHLHEGLRETRPLT